MQRDKLVLRAWDQSPMTMLQDGYLNTAAHLVAHQDHPAVLFVTVEVDAEP